MCRFKQPFCYEGRGSPHIDELLIFFHPFQDLTVFLFGNGVDNQAYCNWLLLSLKVSMLKQKVMQIKYHLQRFYSHHMENL